MGIFYYLMTPFTALLGIFYNVFQNYGMSLICFAVVVKLVLFPFSIKGKKGMIQMNMLSGKMQQLQRQYGKDQQRYNEELQKLYARENANPMSGCLWSFLPILVLIPLYSIIREPMVYMMGLTMDQIMIVAETLNWETVSVAEGWVTADAMAKLVKQVAEGELTYAYANANYNQMYLASMITPETLPAVQAALGEAGSKVFAINFNFLGLDLAMLPTWKIWQSFNWPTIGSLILILISAGSSLVFSKISMNTNKMAQQQVNEQVERTNRIMMFTMPLMSLWIGFAMPVALCLYWVAQNLLSMVQEVIAGKILKKDYEAARIAAEQRAIEEKEFEKRRKEEARLERARRIEEEKLNKKKKKSAEPKAVEEQKIVKSDSTIGMRAYARGRSYDPNRFGGVTPYVDPNSNLVDAKGRKIGADGKVEEKTVEEEKVEKAPVQETPVQETAAPAPVTTPVETEEVEVEVEQIEVEVDENDKEGI